MKHPDWQSQIKICEICGKWDSVIAGHSFLVSSDDDCPVCKGYGYYESDLQSAIKDMVKEILDEEQ